MAERTSQISHRAAPNTQGEWVIEEIDGVKPRILTTLRLNPETGVYEIKQYPLEDRVKQDCPFIEPKHIPAMPKITQIVTFTGPSLGELLVDVGNYAIEHSLSFPSQAPEVTTTWGGHKLGWTVELHFEPS